MGINSVAAEHAGHEHDQHHHQAGPAPQNVIEVRKHLPERGRGGVLGRGLALGPRKNALAVPLAHQQQIDENRGGTEGAEQRGYFGVVGHQQGTDDRRGCCPAHRLAETHEGVQPPLLIQRHQVDGHTVDGDILSGREGIDDESDPHQQAHLARGVLDQAQPQQADHHAQLHRQHPWPALAHGQELVVVHQRPDQQLEGPGKHDHPQKGGDFGGCHALHRQPGRQGDMQQALGNTLGEIGQRAGEIAGT
jgi:hypothetical protein